VVAEVQPRCDTAENPFHDGKTPGQVRGAASAGPPVAPPQSSGTLTDPGRETSQIFQKILKDLSNPRPVSGLTGRGATVPESGAVAELARSRSPAETPLGQRAVSPGDERSRHTHGERGSEDEVGMDGT
jgi:hypothetical protein